MNSKCEICLAEKETPGFFKWPDCGPGGTDMDGFCCIECAELKPADQIEVYTSTRIAMQRLRDDALRAFIKINFNAYPSDCVSHLTSKLIQSRFTEATPCDEVAGFLKEELSKFYEWRNL